MVQEEIGLKNDRAEKGKTIGGETMETNSMISNNAGSSNPISSNPLSSGWCGLGPGKGVKWTLWGSNVTFQRQEKQGDKWITTEELHVAPSVLKEIAWRCVHWLNVIENNGHNGNGRNGNNRNGGNQRNGNKRNGYNQNGNNGGMENEREG